LAISSALTNTLPGSSAASVSSTNVDYPAVGSADKVEPVHRVAGALTLLPALLNVGPSAQPTCRRDGARRSVRPH
jgi:hypothetical protein